MFQNIAYITNGFYPIGLDGSQVVDWARKCICAMFIAEIVLVWILRFVSILYSKFCGKCTSKSGQENSGNIIKLESGANLKDKVDDAAIPAKTKPKQNKQASRKRNATDKLKVVELIPKKSNKIHPEKKKSEQKMQLKDNKIKPRHLKPIEPVQKQKDSTKKQDNIFKFDSAIQFLTNKQDDSDSSSQSSTQEDTEVDTEKYDDDMEHFINIKNLKLTFNEFVSAFNILISHSFIAFAVTFLYFPYMYIALMGAFHFLILIFMIALNVFCFGNISKNLSRFLSGIVYLINLGVIGVSIFGIMRANQDFYQQIYNI